LCRKPCSAALASSLVIGWSSKSGRVITILPEPPGSSDDTPAQRRMIDAQIAEGLDDIRKGRVSPRFGTVDEMLASLKGKSTQRPKKSGAYIIAAIVPYPK
jgi:hypothetical protein